MSAITPGFDQFVPLARQFSHVPLAATLIFDDLNPLNAFARLQADSRRAFLLESVVGGENVARYSFLGSDPPRTLEICAGRAVLRDNRSGQAVEESANDPLLYLARLLRGYRAAPPLGLPRFVGGAVGYAAYDLARYYQALPDGPPDDRGLPELLFDFYESVVVFDHVTKLVHVVAHAEVPAETGSAALRRCYAAAAEQVEGLIERLGWPYALDPARVVLPVEPGGAPASNLSVEEYGAVAARCREHVRAGEVAWLAPALRWEITTRAEPLSIYRALRVVCPAPFMFYVKSPQVTLIGASPQMLCRVAERVASMRLLTGRRVTGATPEEDARLQTELLADQRERTLHAALLNAARDDLTQAVEPDSLRASEAPTIDCHSRVMHLASAVSGRLRSEVSGLDVLRVTLPSPACVGMPRQRAMQIVDRYEPVRRGPYGGAIGYVDFAGNLDTCVGMQTLVLRPAGNGRQRSPTGRRRRWCRYAAGAAVSSSAGASLRPAGRAANRGG